MVSPENYMILMFLITLSVQILANLDEIRQIKYPPNLKKLTVRQIKSSPKLRFFVIRQLLSKSLNFYKIFLYFI